MKTKIHISASVILLAAVQGQAQATTITLDFTSLPSAQGWTYFSSGAAETDVLLGGGRCPVDERDFDQRCLLQD